MWGLLRMMEEDEGVAGPREERDKDMDEEREGRGILTVAGEFGWEPNDLIRLIIAKRSLDGGWLRKGREAAEDGGVGRM